LKLFKSKNNTFFLNRFTSPKLSSDDCAKLAHSLSSKQDKLPDLKIENHGVYKWTEYTNENAEGLIKLTISKEHVPLNKKHGGAILRPAMVHSFPVDRCFQRLYSIY